MFDNSDSKLLETIFKDYKENTKRAYCRHINDFFQYFNFDKLEACSSIDIHRIYIYPC